MAEKEIRCTRCNRLLAKGVPGSIEVKCPRCGTLNSFSNEITKEPQTRARLKQMEDNHV